MPHPTQTTNLLALVRDKQAQIAKLQAELDEVRRFLVGDTGSVVTTAPRRSSPKVPRADLLPGLDHEGVRGARRRRGGRDSSITMAVAVVSESGRPIHVDDMIAKIATKYGKKVEKQTLVSGLARLVKRGEIFERTGPNTFGLKEGH